MLALSPLLLCVDAAVATLVVIANLANANNLGGVVGRCLTTRRRVGSEGWLAAKVGIAATTSSCIILDNNPPSLPS